MKKKILLSSFVGLIGISSSQGIEIPAPEPPKPQVEDNTSGAIKPQVKLKVKPSKPAERAGKVLKSPAKGVKVAYLGVAGEPISDLLGEHLGIAKGVVLHAVVEDSPAGRAGLRTRDIITEFNGQKVGSQDELRKAIQGSKPGQQAQASFIRKGKKVDQMLTLGFKLKAKVQPQQLPELNQDLMRNRLRAMGLQDKEADALLKQLGGALPQAQRFEMRRFGQEKDAKRSFKKGFRGNSSVSLRDSKGSIKLESGPDGKMLTAKDLDGNLLFEGPYTTEDEKLAVPEDIRRRAKALETDKMFQFELK